VATAVAESTSALYLEINTLDDLLAVTEERLADTEATVVMLRAVLAERVTDAQKHVDTLERIADDWSYYLKRGQTEMLPDIHAQVELLLADMKGSL
jgi:hypothetical protein